MHTARHWLRLMLVAVLTSAWAASAAWAQSITVYSSGSLEKATTRQLSAYVPLTNPAIVWSVNDIPGGNATVGTVNAKGLYAAPAVVPSPNVVTVKATSVAQPAKFGAVSLTITERAVRLWGSYPSSVPVGPYSVSLNGANFSTASVPYVNGQPVTGTLVSGTSLKIQGVAPADWAGKSIPMKVVNTGLGGTTSETAQLAFTAAAPVAVSVSPSAASVQTGATRQFGASVANSSNTAVVWRVNGVTGGNALIGTISAAGLYTAPATVPNPATVTVSAQSVAAPGASATASVTVGAPLPAVAVSVSPASASVNAAGSVQFSAGVTGSANTGVSWSVNGVTGGNASVGTISATGLYTAPASLASSIGVTVRATSVANGAAYAQASVAVSAVLDPGAGLGTPNLRAARLLEQAAFGPTPAAIQQVNSLGVNAWIEAQLSMPETAIPNPGGMAVSVVQQGQMYRMSAAPDQLRQRMIFALSQLLTISFNKNIYPDQMVPYLQLLSRQAFGNYRTLLGELTLSTQMGKYLDMANSAKPGVGGGANENYARELMQLFTIGLVALEEDGSPRLDAQGRTIPLYNQATIGQVALALTGWTYPGPNPTGQNWENFSGPMVPRATLHDTSAKSFLGCNLAAGQTPQQDVDATLDCVFNHPNTPPFVSLRLIRNLVTSNPSPAYVQRVVNVFKNNGVGVRGDLKAVVRAILTDAEARNDNPPPGFGRLKDPLPHAIAVLRAVGGGMSASSGLSYLFGQMGQAPLVPNTVFGYFAALFRVPGTSLAGPEFQIYTPAESVMRHNLMYALLTQPGGDFTADWSPFVAVAGNITALIDKVDQTFLYGRMPRAMRQSLATAIAAQPDNAARAQVALLLTLVSGAYAVQY